jgi:hypothetical protein
VFRRSNYNYRFDKNEITINCRLKIKIKRSLILHNIFCYLLAIRINNKCNIHNGRAARH